MNEITKYHWGVENTVLQLRRLRVQSLEKRNRRNKPPKLPSRKELQVILDGLSGVLFPNRLGRPDLTEEGIDYFVGFTLDRVLHDLFKQIRRELQFVSGSEDINESVHQRAIEITQFFNSQLPIIRELIDSDIQAAYEGDPAAQTLDEVLICYPGIMAVIYQRLAHILYKNGAPLVARMITELAHSATGIDIHPGAEIGESFFIDHGTGVVIGETTIIGRNVRLYQAVTLGAKRFEKAEDGSLVKGNLRHPMVEDDVVIYAGATILGRVTIGKGSVIGGNVWLTHSVPPRSVITQASERSE
jgi:serine O-acetyltransferase